MLGWGRTCIACGTRGALLSPLLPSLLPPLLHRRFFHASAPTHANKRDPFDVLGVMRGASRKEIKKAYLEKAKQHHPDQNAGDSTKQFLEIQEAYESIQGIVTMRSPSTDTSTSSSTPTYEDDRPRTRGHGYARDGQDVYDRVHRNDPQHNQQMFHDTVKVGHIPLVFVAEWDKESSSLVLRTHSFKSRAHPNDPAFNNEESVFATVRHSKLDNGAPCIDLMWDDGSIVAKSFSQSNAKFHNPRANNMQPNTNKEETNVKTQDAGPKMTLEGGKMVVEDADGTLMGHIVPDNSWLRRGLRIEDPTGIKIGRASWSRFSPTMIECEDEFGKKIATGILQDKKWVVHLSPLASLSQHEVSPLFWILTCFWAQ